MNRQKGLSTDGAQLLLLLVIPIVGWSWMPKMLLLLSLVVVIIFG